MTPCIIYLLVLTALILSRTVLGWYVPTALIVLWSIVTAGKLTFHTAVSAAGAFSVSTIDNDE